MTLTGKLFLRTKMLITPPDSEYDKRLLFHNTHVYWHFVFQATKNCYIIDSAVSVELSHFIEGL